MAPRPATGKNVPTRNPPERGAPVKSGAPAKVKSATGRKAKEKQKRQKPKLKGWLETKADWAKFDAWAKINAQPRKIPEPEPLVRASKPLSQMKKRIAFLSQPHKQRQSTCRTDLGVSKKALTAKPSKRILQLAMFIEKRTASCREFPIKISRAALRYKASRRIIEISRPHEFYISEECIALMKSHDAASGKISDRRKRLALAKKAIVCPDLLTDEEMNILMTEGGIYRSALNYKFTPWMNYLSLPSYRFLKDRKDDHAKNWKKYILEQNETRGKRALNEKKKKEGRMRKREEEAARKTELAEKQQQEEDQKTDEQPTGMENGDDKDNTTAPEENPEETVADTSNEMEDGTGDAGQNLQPKESKKNMKKEEPPDITQNGGAGDSKKDGEDTEEDEAAMKRKAERNAWRFELSPCIHNPFAIKRSALKGKVSPRMAELAVSHRRRDRSCKKNPFAVRKSALDGPIPERMAELAKPPHPRDPVERPPPREKDSFGRPIYPMPPYGKKMPRVKPYQPAECPDKNANDENEDKRKERKKPRSIDPIAYESTIDPCIDPERAKRQLKARKFAKEAIARKKETQVDNDKENEPPQSELVD